MNLNCAHLVCVKALSSQNLKLSTSLVHVYWKRWDRDNKLVLRVQFEELRVFLFQFKKLLTYDNNICFVYITILTMNICLLVVLWECHLFLSWEPSWIGSGQTLQWLFQIGSRWRIYLLTYSNSRFLKTLLISLLILVYLSCLVQVRTIAMLLCQKDQGFNFSI